MIEIRRLDSNDLVKKDSEKHKSQFSKFNHLGKEKIDHDFFEHEEHS
jgi:hypothetical protein